MHTCFSNSLNRASKTVRDGHKGSSSRILASWGITGLSSATLGTGLLILFSAVFLYPASLWAEVVELTSTKDTYLFENVAISHRSDVALQTKSPERRTALLQFNLSDIPQGAQIVSAKLKLYMNSRDEFRRDSATRVYAVLGSWSESINWFERPPRASSFEDSVAVTAKGRYFEWEITDLTQDWVSGVKTNNGVSIVSEGGGELYFHSRENTSNKPVLTVEYTTDDGPIENSPPIVNLTANRTSGRAPLTVTFNSNARDPGGSIAEHRWDFDGNGVVDQTTTTGQISIVYDESGQYTATVTVIDNEGASEEDSIIINVSSSTIPPEPSVTPQPSPSAGPSPNPSPSGSNPWKYSTGKTFDIMCVSTNETDSTLEMLASSGECTSFLTSWEQDVSTLIKTTPGSSVDWVVAYFNFGSMDTRQISFHDARFFNNVIRPQHPEWILRETNSSGCNGAELGLDNLSFQAAMDIGSIGSGNTLDSDKYVDRWIQEVLENYEEKDWDGIWADIFALWFNGRYVRLNTDGNATPCNPRTGRRYTEAEWHTDLLNATKRIKRFFDSRNLILLAQTGGTWSLKYDDPKVQEMSDNIHVIHIENFAIDYDQSAHRFEDWLRQTEVIQDILRNRLATIVIRMPGGNKGISRDKRFFQDASWLLVKEQNMMKRTFTKLGLAAIDPWWTTTNLGRAQGDMFVVLGTEVRRRNYQNGIVLVNPDDTGTYTVNLGGSYVDIQTGDSVSSITLTPKKGVILTR